jgi:1,4-alpha-glucan branching enzyme
LAYARISDKEKLVVVANFTPAIKENYRIGVPAKGYYYEILNTDEKKYYGSNQLNVKKIKSEEIIKHGRDHSIALRLPPLGVTILKHKKR